MRSVVLLPLLLLAGHAASYRVCARATAGLHRPPSPLARARSCGRLVRCLVSEEDVEALVEKAETLWESALAARKKADTLSSEAEAAANAAAVSSDEQAAKLDDATKFSLGLLSGASDVMASSLDAGALLAEAVEAAEEAERLELEAEAALAASEAAIEQHLKDFPDDDSDSESE